MTTLSVRWAGVLPVGLRRPRPRATRLAVAAVVATATTLTTLALLQALAGAFADRTAGSQLDAAVARARAAGYSDADLGPVVVRARALDAVSPPLLAGRVAFPGQYMVEVAGVEQELRAREAEALARYRARAIGIVDRERPVLDAAVAAGADPQDTDALGAQVTALAARAKSAPTPVDLAGVERDAARLDTRIRAILAAAETERSQLLSAAAALSNSVQGDAGRLRTLGQGFLSGGRNDATVAMLMKVPAAAALSRRLDTFAPMLAMDGIEQVSLGAAGAQLYSSRLHQALVLEMPRKVIVVSITAQELWAYQDGSVVRDTLVTTGRPELPTDIGAMKVLKKDSPWKMHSPWPHGSPYWYPDTTVQKVTWFTVTGEGMHDAYWEPASYYGPGGQHTSAASHGCIHLPDAANGFIFDWAEIRTPVIVYPGDGTPPEVQLAQVSVDADGVPLTGPKGS